jgi:hypothetical protein
METYNVILHKGVNYQSFWDDMELSDDGGTLHIPNRRVDSPNLRPNSPRQAWYTLSAEDLNLEMIFSSNTEQLKLEILLKPLPIVVIF